jgi:hypothetical protein
MSHQILEHAAELPAAWDGLAGSNYALRKDFLEILETTVPCGQRYHLFFDDSGDLDSIVLTFCARMNLAQYTPLNYFAQVTLAHIPISVTAPGLVVGKTTGAQVEKFLRGLKGYSIVLNWRGKAGFARMVGGRMSPQVSLRLRWNSFDAYLASLRSGYRRRNLQALKKGGSLRFRFLQDNREFSDTLYSFYLYVNQKSRIRIETLPAAYFRSEAGRILVCESGDEPVGFMQLIENGTELVWAFVGYNPAQGARLDVYQNMLLFVVRHAIEHGFETLEMGQTAEAAKLKLGGTYTPLQILIRHSNPVMNFILKLFMPFLAHRPEEPKYRPFREQAQEVP